ncbi:acyltransferase family protein [Streptomyces sp. W16]|uniref:acyltransferase family protein n=1 Tax=Streptomyces sp. W16 TaxID=3076631 RepID=UPI00295AA4F7|nr:acyltransferase family protein [Streptomyces sp. W16]MDV9173643.1 acyltransferase family protein [Streptomyces sp. W16]
MPYRNTTTKDVVPERTAAPAPQARAVPERAVGPSAKPRDPFFDNAKYLAIVLVAIGHSWEPLRSGSRGVTALYTLVYAVHMPAFIVISGYFSRSFRATPPQIRRLLTGIVVPYVVFETAYTLFTRWTDHQPDRAISLLDPLYLTWFLAALFVWRLTTPMWNHVRHPLPLALAVAMLATLSPSIGNDLDFQRLLQFLPYFVLGLSLKPEHFQLVRRPEVRQLAVPVFVCALALAYWAVPRFDYSWLFHNASAEQLGAPDWEGPLMTLALFACSTLLVGCFLAWVPRRRTWFTALGAGTLYGYLLHGFLAQGAKSWGWYGPSWVQGPLGEITVTVVAAAVVTALCTPPVRRAFRFAMEPEMRWAFRRDATELARTS